MRPIRTRLAPDWPRVDSRPGNPAGVLPAARGTRNPVQSPGAFAFTPGPPPARFRGGKDCNDPGIARAHNRSEKSACERFKSRGGAGSPPGSFAPPPAPRGSSRRLAAGIRFSRPRCTADSRGWLTRVKDGLEKATWNQRKRKRRGTEDRIFQNEILRIASARHRAVCRAAAWTRSNWGRIARTPASSSDQLRTVPVPRVCEADPAEIGSKVAAERADGK